MISKITRSFFYLIILAPSLAAKLNALIVKAGVGLIILSTATRRWIYLCFTVVKHILSTGSVFKDKQFVMLFFFGLANCVPIPRTMVVSKGGVRSAVTTVTEGIWSVLFQLLSLLPVFLPLPILVVHHLQTHPVLESRQWNVRHPLTAPLFNSLAFGLALLPRENLIIVRFVEGILQYSAGIFIEWVSTLWTQWKDRISGMRLGGETVGPCEWVFPWIKGH